MWNRSKMVSFGFSLQNLYNNKFQNSFNQRWFFSNWINFSSNTLAPILIGAKNGRENISGNPSETILLSKATFILFFIFRILYENKKFYIESMLSLIFSISLASSFASLLPCQFARFTWIKCLACKLPASVMNACPLGTAIFFFKKNRKKINKFWSTVRKFRDFLFYFGAV